MSDPTSKEQRQPEQIEALEAKVADLERRLEMQIQVEEVLRKHNASYQLIAQRVRDVVWLVDPDIRFKSISASAHALTGYTLDELLEINPIEIAAEGGSEIIRTNLAQMREDFLRTGNRLQIRKFEFEIFHKQGDRVFVEAEATLLVDAAGQVEGYLGIARDITLHRRATGHEGRSRQAKDDSENALLNETTLRLAIEKELRDSEEKYRRLIDLAMDGICILRQGEVLYCNRQLAEMIGVTQQEIVGRNFLDFVHPDHRGKIVRLHNRRMAGESNQEIVETRLFTPGRKEIWTELNAGLIVYENAPAEMVLFRDITERRYARLALETSESKYRMLVENSGEGVGVVDADEKFLYANHSANKIFGVYPKSLIGRNLLEFVTAAEAEKLERQTRLRKKGKVNTYDLEISTDFGEARKLMITATPQYDDNGNYVGAHGIFRDMSERRRAEQALRDSESRFRMLADTTAAAIFMYHIGDLIYFNSAAERMTGYTFDELRMMDPWAVIHPDYREMAIQRGRARMNGEPVDSQYELKIVHKSGKEIWVEFSAGSFSYHGKPAVLGTAFDITERKKSEAAMIESESRFRLLAETTAAAIFFYRGDKLLYVNNAAIQITGFSRSELEKMNFWDMIHPAFRGMARSRGIDRQKGEDVTPRYEVMIMTKDGRERWVDFSAGVLEVSGERAVLGTAFDITDRKHSEEALRISELRYRRLAENAQDMIWRTNPDGTVSYVNAAAEKITGYRPEEAMGMTADQYLTIESRERLAKLMETGENHDPPIDSYQVEIEYIHKLGHIVVCDLVMTVLRDAAGTAVSMEGISRDITERKKVEIENARQTKQLNQAQKLESIGTLAGGIAHDFNNSLQVVLTSINLMEEMDSDPEGYQQTLKTVKKATKQMARWTNDLLAYARGSFSVKQPLDVNRSIANAFTVARHNFTGRIDFSTDLEQDLPMVLASPGEMEQVFVNLFINAGEAINDRGEIRVLSDCAKGLPDHPDIRTDPDMIFVHVRVEDNGAGMDRNTRERIFEPFFSTKFIGRGMGMSVVFGIIKSIKGYIFVDSEPGKGTRFDLYFPIVQATVPTMDTTPTPRSLTSQTRKVLIIDDEVELVETTAFALQRRGYVAFSATSGKQAIVLAKENPDIGFVILDMVMPEMDGLEAYVNLRQILPRARYLVISGYDEKGPAHEVMDAGAHGFLQKPFEISSLLKKLEKVQNLPTTIETAESADAD